MPATGPSPQLFFDTITAYQRTEALRAAIELNLFTHVSAGRHTVEEIAKASGAASRGIRALTNYLTILGFLHKDGDGYRLTQDSEVFLDRKSPAYVGGAVGFLLTDDLREAFDQLTSAVRKGGTALTGGGTV